MSNLNSVFDTLRGWPDGSSLEKSFTPKSGDTYAEGAIVKTNTDGSGGTHVEALSSAVKAGNPYDDAWIVIQGNDQYDAAFVNKVTCLKLMSGTTVKVQTDIADTLAIGDMVSANAGVLEKTVAGAGMKNPVGLVIESNGVSGSGGWIKMVSL